MRWSQRRLALSVPLSRLTSLARCGSSWVVRPMNTLARRILIWAASGAAGGVTYALPSLPTIHVTLISLFIGAVSGATAGAVASIPAQKLIQTVLTGAAGGLSVGVLSYWLLGSSRSFGAHISSTLVGFVAGIVVIRYLSPLFHKNTRQDSKLWAEHTDVSKA